MDETTRQAWIAEIDLCTDINRLTVIMEEVGIQRPNVLRMLYLLCDGPNEFLRVARNRIKELLPAREADRQERIEEAERRQAWMSKPSKPG